MPYLKLNPTSSPSRSLSVRMEADSKEMKANAQSANEQLNAISQQYYFLKQNAEVKVAMDETETLKIKHAIAGLQTTVGGAIGASAEFRAALTKLQIAVGNLEVNSTDAGSVYINGVDIIAQVCHHVHAAEACAAQ